MASVSLAEAREVGPVLEVLGGIETHLLLAGENHDPSVGDGIPEHFRVAEVGDSIRQHRVAGIMGERLSAVKAVRNRLFLALAIGGEQCHHGVLSETGGVIAVNDARTGENRPEGGRTDCYRLVLPMEQVTAGGMCPVHVSPHRTVGVMLVVEVPET